MLKYRVFGSRQVWLLRRVIKALKTALVSVEPVASVLVCLGDQNPITAWIEIAKLSLQLPLAEKLFLQLLFVRCPASVTPHLISTIWCFRPYKPYIFCEDMILATCQCHSFLSWAQFTVVWSFTCVCIISFWWKRQIMHTNFTMILWTCNRVDQKLHKTNFQLICHKLLSWPVGHSYM